MECQDNLEDEARISLKYVWGENEDLTLKVGVHQGSTLSPYLFTLVVDELTKEVQEEIAWSMMFADDVI